MIHVNVISNDKTLPLNSRRHQNRLIQECWNLWQEAMTCRLYIWVFVLNARFIYHITLTSYDIVCLCDCVCVRLSLSGWMFMCVLMCHWCMHDVVSELHIHKCIYAIPSLDEMCEHSAFVTNWDENSMPLLAYSCFGVCVLFIHWSFICVCHAQ